MMKGSEIEKQSNPLPWIFGLAVGGILLLVGWNWVSWNRFAKSENDWQKYTVVVRQETINPRIRASGKVEAIDSVNISPKNPGKIARLLVDQGTVVKKGQLIAIVENGELYAQGAKAEATLREAEAALKERDIAIQGEIQRLAAQLAQATANLEETRERIPRQIEQVASQLKEAESRLLLAETELNRNEQLLKDGVITQSQFDQLANQYLVAKANVQQIQQRLEELKRTAQPTIRRLEATVREIQIALQERQVRGKAEIERLKASVKAAQANLELAKIQYQDSFIVAPFDGIVTQRFATEGSFVTPTTSASSTASATSTSIVALARGLEIVAKVPEIDLKQIRVGQPVEIIADAYPTETFRGVVKRIAPAAIVEQNVTSFEVKIDILTGKEKLLSGMNVEVQFLGQPQDTIVLPTVAIVTEKGQTGVMIPDERGKPKFKPVTIGITVEDKTQILSGLSPGERVFINLPENRKRGVRE